MRSKMKRTIAILLAALLAISLCACHGSISIDPSDSGAPAESSGVPAEEGAAETSLINGSPWNDSCILGNLPAEAPAPADDLYAAFGYDWLSAQTEVPDGYLKYGVREELDTANRMALLGVIQDECQSGPEAKLVRTMYQAAMDVEARNEAALEPLAPYVRQLLEIKTLPELTAWLSSGEAKPCSPLFGTQMMANPYDAGQYMLVILPTTGDFDTVEDAEAASDSVFIPLMERLGIPEEEIAAMNLGASALTAGLDASLTDLGAIGSPRAQESRPAMAKIHTLAQLADLSPNYPLTAILKAEGYDAAAYLSLLSPNWLKTLDSLYTEENLPGFKGILLHDMLTTMAPYLDEESAAWAEELTLSSGGTVPSAPEDKAFAACQTFLTTPLAKLFVDNFLTEETRQDVFQMVEEIRGALRGRLEDAEWMSEETRQLALEKLDAIQVRVGRGEKWRDWSGLTLPEGGVLAQQVLAAQAFDHQLRIAELAQPINPDYWIIDNSEYTVGAGYEPSSNSINIPAGILQPPFYYAEGSVEQRYFAVGAIIGHELTHGFDPSGSYFDKDGNLGEWWQSEDRAQFEALQQKVKDYFGAIEVKPGEFLNADNCLGEITADLAGLSLVIEAAEDRGNVDYPLAFETYANLWPEVESTEMASMLLENDEHPPKYVRANAVAQQFEEFYEAFDVQEGDGMYLAPEERVAIW